MADQAPAYAGSIPAQYDAKLGPMLFEPHARDLAGRLPASACRVLETAAGTGIVSRRLLERLAPTATLVVTDLHQGMLDVAARKIGQDPRVDIRQADAVALPFDDHEFDVVVCQFGLMFFSDPVAAVREARRVLASDGVLLLSTWGPIEDNPIARIAFETVSEALPDVPAFLTAPFSMHDTDVVVDLLHRGGFTYVQSRTLDSVAESASAYAAAMGMLCGSPTVTQLQERGIGDPRGLVDAVSARLAREGGFAPMRLPMKAHVFTAQ